MSYALIITTTTTDNITVRSNNNTNHFVNNSISFYNNDIRFKIEIATQIEIVYHEKPSNCIPIYILANQNAKPKMQKRMQSNAFRFSTFDRQTMQTYSEKGYLQHRFGNSGSKFGKLKFDTYIYILKNGFRFGTLQSPPSPSRCRCVQC